MSTNAVTITTEPDTPFIDIVREFDAPVERVFAAHTDPELFARWIGPRGYDTTIDALDTRTGGRYRFVQTGPTGSGPFAFNGIFHVVHPNELIIQTFEFEGVPNVVSLESHTFETLPGGRSRLSSHSVFPSIAARDGMVASGMEHGIVEGYERLDELIAA